MAHGLQELLASDELTDEAVLRAAQDYVREVVAHEVGHILGLRHNFAGSLGATLTAKELERLVQSVSARQAARRLHEQTRLDFGHGIHRVQRRRLHRLADAHAANSRCRTTARRFAGAILTAARRARTRCCLPRTRTRRTTATCGRLITGRNPSSAPTTKRAQLIDLLPNNLIETFIRARAPQNPHDRIPLEQVNLNYTARGQSKSPRNSSTRSSGSRPTRVRCAWKTSSISSAN